MVKAFEIITDNGWTAVAILTVISIFIQITPVKINPLSWIGNRIIVGIKWLGRQLNSELLSEMDKYQYKVKEHIEKSDEKFAEIERSAKEARIDADKKRIKDLRWEMLDFGNSVKTSTYQKEAFEHIFEQYDEYKTLIQKYNKKNGQVDRAMSLITNIYNERQEDPDF